MRCRQRGGRTNSLLARFWLIAQSFYAFAFRASRFGPSSARARGRADSSSFASTQRVGQVVVEEFRRSNVESAKEADEAETKEITLQVRSALYTLATLLIDFCLQFTRALLYCDFSIVLAWSGTRLPPPVLNHPTCQSPRPPHQSPLPPCRLSASVRRSTYRRLQRAH